MADLIDRKELRDMLYEADAVTMQGVKIINQITAVNAVEVVRCEKCKHAVCDEEYEMWKCVEYADYDEELGEFFGFCQYHNGDFFCAYGERKDGDGNG